MQFVLAAIRTITLAALLLQSVIACSQSNISVAGVVINAKTGTPISRALVKIGDRAALTDSDGHFQFNDIADSATVSVRKPGFYPGIDQADRGEISLSSLSSYDGLVLSLYPEALLTGSLRSQGDLPLRAITVEAIRKNANSLSNWSTAAITRTDSHGDFRLTLPAGEYRLETVYVPMEETTRKTVLPVSYPDPGPTDTSTSFRLRNGEEQHVDLRAVVASSQDVFINAIPERNGRNFKITARTAEGIEFALAIHSRGSDGTLRTTLPEGSYSLHAFRDDGENMEEAATAINVPDHELSGVLLRFSQVTSIPIEVEESNTDTSTAGLPATQQLGLVLKNTMVSDQKPIFPMPDGKRGMRFVASSGTYRLRAQGSSQWFIQSALYGDTDLLTNNLVVTPGESATPIRLIVSNQTVTLQGTTTLHGNPAARCSVYLVAVRGGSVFTASSNAEGGFSFTGLPPGDYQAVAFERPFSPDFDDPAFQELSGQHLQNVTISPDDSATVHLDAVAIQEMLQ